MDDFRTSIKQIAATLSNHKINYMVIGGQALLQYGEPRLTQDIDITLGITQNDASMLLKTLQQNGYMPVVEDPIDLIRQTNVLPVKDKQSNIRIDLIFSNTSYEQEAIARSKKIDVGGGFVNFVSPEDLIIHKLVASRPRDLEDIRNIILRNLKLIDKLYIKMKLKEFKTIPGLEDIENVWNEMLSNQ